MSKAVVPSSIVFEVLDGHNYVDWSEAIEAYLKAQDLWDVVKSDQHPSKKEDETQFKAWKKKNAAALHAIKISCGTNTLPYIRGIRRASKAWSCLGEKLTNPRSYYDNRQHLYQAQVIRRPIADEENVDHKLVEAYKDLGDALSKSNLSDAIELCEKYPLLLTKTLPNDRLVLNELIKLGGRYHEGKVVDILRSFDELGTYLFQTIRYRVKPLDVAIMMGAIEIAKCLAQMQPELLFSFDAQGLTPLAVAIGSHMNEMANMLYELTPQDSFWTVDNATSTATVIIKCFEAENLEIPLKLLNSSPEEFILAEDSYGNSPLCAAARAPHLFRHTYHHRFLPKCIGKGSINFEISGMEFLFHLGNAISDSSTHSKKKIDIISEAFFEAIKHENFNFILMLIKFLRPIVNFTNNEGRNLYMLAIAHRSAKIFSLYFWNNRDEADSDPSRSIDKWDNNLLHMVGASTPRIAFNRISKPALLMKRELMWFKEVEELVPDSQKKSRNRDGKTPYELFNESRMDLVMEKEKWMKDSASSWAGPLIITIMFAAAFQVPGGSLQDKGYPVFLEERLFKVYMVLVAISLFSASISVLKFLEINSANNEDKDFLASLRAYNVITGTLILSLATMLVAFCMGLFLTLHGKLAIFLPIAAMATFLVGYIIYKNFPLLAEIFEEVKIHFIKRRTSIFDRNIGHEVERIFQMLNQPTK